MHRSRLHPATPLLLGFALLADMPAAASATVTANLPALTPTSHIADGGFEQPNVAAGTHVYGASGSAWVFDASSGITGNGGTFGTPIAPEGDQAAVLRAGGMFSQSVTVPATGRYRLTLHAAQRHATAMRTAITLDGATVGEVNPSGTAWQAFVFDALLLTAGTHVLALDDSASDARRGPALVFDDVRLTSTTLTSARWSDASTWSGGVVPGPDDDVVIPAGAVVLLDTDAHTKTLNIQGELHCDDTDITLDANDVSVTGRLVCGSPFARYVDTFVLTLRGDDQGAGGMHGHKFLAAMAPGVIELHGEKRRSWTQLAATANVGATGIALADPVNWRAGDEIVIAPTLDDPAQGEVATIVSVSPDGLALTFQPPLSYRHYGERSNWTNGVSSWTLDERAEVGLLTRNIRIQGDVSSTSTAYGGHMMTMAGASIRASGIELYRMGQQSLLRRYPFHWHLARDVPGQYIESSSIHESYNRCITIHGTNHARVADNVCYNFIGHGYFLEDGIEQHNVLDGNLAILARRGNLLESDSRIGTASNGPAAFWISNPTNTLTGNVAAGSEGSGFWYRVLAKIDKDSDSYGAKLPGYDTMNPKRQPFGVFADNRAHTGKQGFTTCEFASGFPGMEPAGFVVSRFSTSNMQQGMWPCVENETSMNGVIEDSIVANAHNGMQAPSPMVMQNSVFIGYTGNPAPFAAEAIEVPTIGISVYDQGFLLDNVHFVNYDRKLATVFSPAAGAHKLTNNRVQGLTFANSPQIALDFFGVTAPGTWHTQWGDVIHDLDGSLVGAGRALVSDHPLMSDASCARPAGMRASGYACPYRYSRFWLDSGFPGATAPWITVQRSDGTQGTGPSVLPHRFVSAYIANGPYRHSYRYDAGIRRNEMNLTIFNGHPGDESVHEILDVPDSIQPWGESALQWSPATSLADLLGGAGRRYFYRAETGSLYIKTVAAAAWIFTGEPWFAGDMLRLCMTAPGPAGCAYDVRTISPPAVTITSPDRAAAGNVTVTANATSTSSAAITSLRLFVDDTEWPPSTTNEATFVVPLATGKHAVKLVARDGLGNAYTALQQLVVGEPEARVAIASHVDNGTYTPSTIGSLAFNAYNLAAAGVGAHLHWFDNGVDQGDVAGASLALSGLSQGRHDIDLAVAHADHSALPARDRRIVWMARDGVLADFEDGVDLRATFRRAETGPPEAFASSYGYRETTRVDGSDDSNFYTTAHGGGTQPRTSLRITLSPPHDFGANGALAVKHHGDAYELVVHYANGTSQSAGFGAAGFVIDTLALPPGPNHAVTGIELLQNEAPPSAVCAAVSPPVACRRQQDLYDIRLVP